MVEKVHVIEIDKTIPEKLQANCEGLGKVIIHCEDVLNFDFPFLIQAKGEKQKIRVVGNLPYNISTPLLFYLLSNINLFQDMHFMLQKEVASRISAKEGSENYGRLSVMIQYYCKTDYLFEVPPESFKPPPKVMSAVIRLTPYEALPYEVKNEDGLKNLVRQAFMQRRKTLKNNLKALVSSEELKQLGIDSVLRPQQLGVREYVAIANYLEEKGRSI